MDEIREKLDEISSQKKLKFAIDELLIDELAAYLVAPVAKRYWLIFLELSKRSVKKNSA